MDNIQRTVINNIEVVKFCGVSNSSEGAGLEIKFVEEKFGVMGKDFDCIFWLRFRREGDIWPTLSIAQITLPDGSEHQVYFDKSDYIGR